MKTTERLILLRPERSDLERYFEIHSAPETNLFNPFGPIKDVQIAEQKLNEIIAHWEKYNFGTWKVTEKENSDYIIGFGGIDYRKYNDELKLNLGYRFAKKSWGKGYATELSKEAIFVGFNEFKVREIFGLVRPNHLASIKVLEKCGFVKHSELNDVPGQENSLVFMIKNESLESSI